MEGLATLLVIIQLAVVVFMISLALRLVKATEKISNAMDKIAQKFENK